MPVTKILEGLKLLVVEIRTTAVRDQKTSSEIRWALLFGFTGKQSLLSQVMSWAICSKFFNWRRYLLLIDLVRWLEWSKNRPRICSTQEFEFSFVGTDLFLQQLYCMKCIPLRQRNGDFIFGWGVIGQI